MRSRLERRLIVALDLMGILIFDAVILLVSYGVIWLIDFTTDGGDQFFTAVKAISGGTFLLLYLVWAGWDLWGFASEQFVKQRLDED